MKKLIVFLFLLIMVLGGAIFWVKQAETKEQEHVPVCTELPEGVTMSRDILYRETLQGNCRMDLAYREDGSAHPLVVFVHGGSWVEGSRESMLDYVYTFAGLGYAAATIDYDFYSLLDMDTEKLVTIREEERCVDAALTYLTAHAAEYGIDPEKILLVGHSSGGQLAGRLTERLAEEPEAHAYQLMGTALMAAPSDLRMLVYENLDDGKTIAPLVLTPFAFDGNYDGEIFEEVDKIDVLANVRGDMVPMLLLHGDYDATVPYQASEHLADAIQELGGSAKLVIKHEHGHNLSVQSVSDEVSRFMLSLLEGE